MSGQERSIDERCRFGIERFGAAPVARWNRELRRNFELPTAVRRESSRPRDWNQQSAARTSIGAPASSREFDELTPGAKRHAAARNQCLGIDCIVIPTERQHSLDVDTAVVERRREPRARPEGDARRDAQLDRESRKLFLPVRHLDRRTRRNTYDNCTGRHAAFVGQVRDLK